MKTVDFSGERTANGEILVPPQIAAKVPRGEIIQIVLTGAIPMKMTRGVLLGVNSSKLPAQMKIRYRKP